LETGLFLIGFNFKEGRLFFNNFNIRTIMANETNNDFAAALSNLFNTSGVLVQQSFELVSTVIKSVVQIIEPIGKSALDLVGSVTCTLGQAVQNVTSALAPKK